MTTKEKTPTRLN